MEEPESVRPPDPASPDDGDGYDAGAEAGWAYTCPSCGSSVSLQEAPAGGLVECPACGAQFFAASGGDESDEAEADRLAREESEEKFNRETEFNENRIKQLTTLRRGLIRTRSYFVVGLAICFGAAAMFLWMAGKAMYLARVAAGAKGWTGVPPATSARSAAMLCAAVAACYGCAYFVRRVREADRELAVPLQTDPQTAPDFSTLSDGSHQWRDLEEMAGMAGDKGREGDPGPKDPA